MIKTTSLKMTYPNGFTAVNGIDMNVNKGDIFGFLGPNGAGKTTTIRMLTGLLKPTSGSVTISGIDVTKFPNEVKKRIGVLPESHGFYNFMTNVEYLTYFADLYGVDKKQAKVHIDELLQKVGLLDKKNVPIGHYSRGMKQRLGLAKILINNPEVIFLDEPTLGLDPIGQKDIYNLIIEINKQRNVTVFITSHLLKDIEVLCNKVCIVKRGVLIEQGEIANLKAKYATQLHKEDVTMEDIFFALTEEKGGDDK